MIRPLVDLPFVVIGALVLLALVVLGLLRSPGERRWWLLRALMVGLLVVLALRPSLGTVPTPTRVAPIEVVVALDRTASMSAPDWNGALPRLDGARRDVRELVDRLPTGRFTLLTFGRRVRTHLPSTQDVTLIRDTVALLEREPLDAGTGSRVDRPIPALRELLTRMRTQHPDRPRVLVLMSDGENTEPRQPRSFARLDPLVDAGLVLGYGTAAGSLIPLDEDDPDAGYVVDLTAGTLALSRLDGDNLRRVAGQMGVPYVHRSRPGGLGQLTAAWEGRFTEQVEEPGREVRTRYEVAWVAALLLFLCALVELRRQWRLLHAARRAQP